jgi:hypothetical protein
MAYEFMKPEANKNKAPTPVGSGVLLGHMVNLSFFPHLLPNGYSVPTGNNKKNKYRTTIDENRNHHR